jgi:hypothetical protein
MADDFDDLVRMSNTRGTITRPGPLSDRFRI